jgi:serine/threonine protein kinase
MNPVGFPNEQTHVQTSTAPEVRPLPSAPGIPFLTPAEQPGELGRLGPYRVLSVLGQGGMGMVFVAEDPRLRRRVALKVMLPQAAGKPVARERFLREARLAALLEHDNIIPVYQVDEDRGVLFIAMPLLKGMNVEDYLLRRGEFTLPQVYRIGREAARGLAAAHAKGLIHRDIKPANLWLDATAKGRVKILDFGLARLAYGDERLTIEGGIVGTPAYMSPEQAAEGEVTDRSDLFSLGAVLYRLATGRRPFTGHSPYAALAALATETPRPVRELNPDVRPAFADLIMQMLEKNPKRRPKSARHVAEAIYAVERQRLLEKLSREGPGLPPEHPSPNPDESLDTHVLVGRSGDRPPAAPAKPARPAAPPGAWLALGVAATAAVALGVVYAAGWARPAADPPAATAK